MYFSIIFSFLFAFITNNACGLSTDESQPIKITANSGIADQKNLMTILTGNIIITRGSIVIHANKGTVHQDANGDKLLTLYGTPITFSQRQDDGQMVKGQCNQFDYNTKTNLAILTGRAKIQKEKDLITGEKITYNTKTQVYSANGSPANGINKKQAGRVTIILDQIENGKK